MVYIYIHCPSSPPCSCSGGRVWQCAQATHPEAEGPNTFLGNMAQCSCLVFGSYVRLSPRNWPVTQVAWRHGIPEGGEELEGGAELEAEAGGEVGLGEERQAPAVYLVIPEHLARWVSSHGVW